MEPGGSDGRRRLPTINSAATCSLSARPADSSHRRLPATAGPRPTGTVKAFCDSVVAACSAGSRTVEDGVLCTINSQPLPRRPLNRFSGRLKTILHLLTLGVIKLFEVEDRPSRRRRPVTPSALGVRTAFVGPDCDALGPHGRSQSSPASTVRNWPTDLPELWLHLLLLAPQYHGAFWTRGSKRLMR